MSIRIRTAKIVDQPAMTALLLHDAKRRTHINKALWPLKADAQDAILAALKASMDAENPPFRQQWLIAERDGEIIGLTHSILLPVPPIYAGEQGPPGLIMEDCALADGAPDTTAAALLAAAEADLRGAGAEILVTSCAVGCNWADVYAAKGYEPLTLYLAKTGLQRAPLAATVRKAEVGDVADIVALSAQNRDILHTLDPFWKPHPQADVRFKNWMMRSLTLTDRDMFVADQGYAISQPATPLHFPPAHEISATGVIDDYYHVAFKDPDTLEDDASARDLLFAVEDALKTRGNDACIVVCPAAWTSKIALLKGAGFETAIEWYIKLQDP